MSECTKSSEHCCVACSQLIHNLQIKVETLKREKEELLAVSKKALQEIQDFLNALHTVDVNSNTLGERTRRPIEKELSAVIDNHNTKEG